MKKSIFSFIFLGGALLLGGLGCSAPSQPTASTSTVPGDVTSTKTSQGVETTRPTGVVTPPIQTPPVTKPVVTPTPMPVHGGLHTS